MRNVLRTAREWGTWSACPPDDIFRPCWKRVESRLCLVVPVVPVVPLVRGGEPRVLDWACKMMNEEQRGARCDAGGAWWCRWCVEKKNEGQVPAPCACRESCTRAW